MRSNRQRGTVQKSPARQPFQRSPEWGAKRRRRRRSRNKKSQRTSFGDSPRIGCGNLFSWEINFDYFSIAPVVGRPSVHRDSNDDDEDWPVNGERQSNCRSAECRGKKRRKKKNKLKKIEPPHDNLQFFTGNSCMSWVMEIKNNNNNIPFQVRFQL